MSVEDFHHGARTLTISDGVRPVRTLETSVIGLVGTAPGANPDKFPLNRPAMINGSRGEAAALGADGTLAWAVDGILDQGGATIIVVRVEEGSDLGETFNRLIGGANDATGAYEGVHALRAAQSRFGVRPRIIAVPGYTHQIATLGQKNPVAAELEGVIERLRAHAIIDGPNTNDADAWAARNTYGNRRIYFADAWGLEWHKPTKSNITRPGSARIAGLIARVDHDEGFWVSPSNHEIYGLTGIARDIDYEPGDLTCRANYLNSKDITVLIQDGGYLLWGNRTLATDPRYTFLSVSRTEDFIGDSIAWSHRWAVDRNIRATYVRDVQEAVNRYLRRLIKLGAIAGGECLVDQSRNPPDLIMQGKFRWYVRWTPSYPCEDMIFELEIVDDWLTEVFK